MTKKQAQKLNRLFTISTNACIAFGVKPRSMKRKKAMHKASIKFSEYTNKITREAGCMVYPSEKDAPE